jgi:hypothetical protein
MINNVPQVLLLCSDEYHSSCMALPACGTAQHIAASTGTHDRHPAAQQHTPLLLPSAVHSSMVGPLPPLPCAGDSCAAALAKLPSHVKK